MLHFRQKQVQNHIDQIVAAINASLEARSVILLGSAARDELSVRMMSPSDFELYSDYECMVVVEKRPSTDQRRALQRKLDQLEVEINNPNPLFHIDIIIREEKRLQALPPIIFTFEMKANGKIVYGDDVLPQVPTVTLDNLDFLNTNEILYKRLWALLLHLPKTFITGQELSAVEECVTGYLLCRNALDITTVLLPYEQILLPTYQQRVHTLDKQYTTLEFAIDFGPEFPDYLQQCLRLRQTLQFENINLQSWYRKTITYLILALNQIGLVEDGISSSKIYNEWPISRGEWYNLALMSKRQLRSHGLRETSQWLRAPKKQMLTLGLLEMHHALLAWQNNDAPGANAHLKRSEGILSTLNLGMSNLLTSGFLHQWFELRGHWAEFWRLYIRLNDKKYNDRFKKVTEWNYL